MSTRPDNKTLIKKLDTIVKKPDADVTVQELPNQRKRPDTGQFRLQVDRQTKSSFPTLEAAEAAGLAIKKEHPLVQVTVYDTVAGMNKTIETPVS